jgi:hypothetical protein
MKKHTANNQKKKHQIDAIEVTSDCLTSRAGLAPCVAYMNQIGIFTKLERYFGSLRKSKKGLPLLILTLNAQHLSEYLTSDIRIFCRRPPRACVA